jgi:DNA repair photolyase
VQRDASRTILARNTSPDIPFDRSINPYRGCEHGCIYCFARPTHAYLGLSPGLDFETHLFEKPEAPSLLETTLRKPYYRPAPIAIGTNTDPYQPIERSRRIMRGILEVLWDFRHPVTIVTKSALITRDIDILAAMARKNLTRVAISITSLDRRLQATLEPRAATPGARLATVKALSDAGIPTAVMMAPIIPALTDYEIEAVLSKAAEAGADAAGWIFLRLPLEVRDLFEEWLRAHHPDRADHVLSLVRQARGGQLYQSAFSSRMRGTGPIADLIGQRFRLAARRLHLTPRDMPLDISQFRLPPRKGDQLTLF